VSYHFGGKRQLYRAALRHAVHDLAHAVRHTVTTTGHSVHDLEAVAGTLDQQLHDRPLLVRLLLRDLADGGSAVVEALAPVTRGAIEAVGDDSGRAVAAAHLLRALGPVLTLHVLAPLLGPATGEEIGRVRAALLSEPPAHR
jgi:AcrR family transcriptional regulator